MRDIIFFSLPPWRFRRLEGVGAAFDYSRHLLSELTLDITEAFHVAPIFHRIMQQSADRFRFVGAVFQRNCRDAEHMPDKRNPRLFAKFAAVNSRGVDQRFFKLRR